MAELSTSPLGLAFRKLEHWGALTDTDREAVLALPHILRTVEVNAFVVRHGDKVTHACVLRSGFLFRHKVVIDGGRQIFSIHMAGDMVDLQNSLLGTADHNVQALTRAEVALIPRDAIYRIAFDRPSIGAAMWKDTLVDAAMFREWAANIGRRGARTRLAHLLCEFALRVQAADLGTHKGYELPMTQEQLADCTGLTSVHVNRMLKSLESDGLLTRTKRAVRVLDWKRLAAAGDFESSYLHLSPDRTAVIE